jgi:hypothetical protein
MPAEIPAGKAWFRIDIQEQMDQKPTDAEYPPDFDMRLKGGINPKLYGKGKILGDIIGPFHDIWENGY